MIRVRPRLHIDAFIRAVPIGLSMAMSKGCVRRPPVVFAALQTIQDTSGKRQATNLSVNQDSPYQLHNLLSDTSADYEALGPHSFTQD